MKGDMTAAITKKICMLGDFGVGKTSLIRRFVERSFSDQYLSTVGVKISQKILDRPDPKPNIKLVIWDIEGQTKFKPIAPSYLQGAAGVVIVADVTRAETIQSFQKHIELFYRANPKGSIVLALNKIDLIDAAVGKKLTDFLVEKINNVAGVYQTSAKTGITVDVMFETLVQQFL